MSLFIYFPSKFVYLDEYLDNHYFYIIRLSRQIATFTPNFAFFWEFDMMEVFDRYIFSCWTWKCHNIVTCIFLVSISQFFISINIFSGNQSINNVELLEAVSFTPSSRITPKIFCVQIWRYLDERKRVHFILKHR